MYNQKTREKTVLNSRFALKLRAKILKNELTLEVKYFRQTVYKLYTITLRWWTSFSPELQLRLVLMIPMSFFVSDSSAFLQPFTFTVINLYLFLLSLLVRISSFYRFSSANKGDKGEQGILKDQCAAPHLLISAPCCLFFSSAHEADVSTFCFNDYFNQRKSLAFSRSESVGYIFNQFSTLDTYIFYL